MNVKQTARRWLRRLGLDVRRFTPATSEDASSIASLSKYGVNLVFDVGANTGQYGRRLRELGYRGRIVSFEPLSVAHERLVAAAHNDELWTVADRMAIGSESGEIEIHISGNSVSSSVLAMLDAHVAAAPGSAYVGTEKAPLRTLDSVALPHVRSDSVLFLKLDTQGYEDKVLQGAAQLIRQAAGVQIELSLVPLYDGQLGYEDMVAKLKIMGFVLWSMAPAFVDQSSGRLLQVDATFFRGTAF